MLETILFASALVILAGSSLALGSVWIHALILRSDDTRYAREAEPERAKVLRALRRDAPDEALIARLSHLRLRHRTRVLMQVGRTVTGLEHNRLTYLAAHTGVLDAALRTLRDGRWWRRLHGVRVLEATGGGQGTVPRLLADPHPIVRAEAAAWCGRYPDEENIRRLLNLLETPTLTDRAAVIDALTAVGRRAVAPLAERLRFASGPGLEAGLIVALGLADASFLPAAIRLSRHKRPAVRVRAFRLLSVIGGDAAREALVAALDDPVPSVRAAAARGLGRLGSWLAAPPLEHVLQDPDPDPRRDAALALADLGPTGLVILKERARGEGLPALLARAVLEAERGTVQRVPMPRPTSGGA